MNDDLPCIGWRFLVGLVVGGLSGVGRTATLAAGAEPALREVEARIMEITFWSETLQRVKSVSIVRPEESPETTAAPVLFLLHGRGRHHRSLLEDERSKAALLRAPFFVVLPDGEDGWYINSPVQAADRYQDYLEEVIRLVERLVPVSREVGQRAIAGWSMGGYGAVRFAQTHASEFAAVVGIVGLLDFPRIADLPEGQNLPGPGPAIWRGSRGVGCVQPAWRGRAVERIESPGDHRRRGI